MYDLYDLKSQFGYILNIIQFVMRKRILNQPSTSNDCKPTQGYQSYTPALLGIAQDVAHICRRVE